MWLSLLTALPHFLKLINAVMAWVRDAEQRGLGRKEAIAEALTIATAEVERVRLVEIEATAIHAKDKTDGAFDQDFKV